MQKIPRNWQDSFIWLMYNSGGMLLPLVVSIILSLGLKYGFSLGSVTDGGQFAIYSAGMMITTFYYVAKPDPRRLHYMEYYVFLCLIALIVSLTLFVLAILKMNGANVDINFIEWPTIVLFIICSVITLFAVNEDCKRAIVTQNDLQSSAEAEQASLERDFDNKYKGK